MGDSKSPLLSNWPPGLSSFCLELPWTPATLLFEKGDKLELIDSKGERYLDAISGIFVTCFGYGCRPIEEAIIDQVTRLPFHSPLLGTNRKAIEFAEALSRLAPEGIRTAKLFSGGSEAVEGALRIVRLFHRAHGRAGKVKILSHFHSYHGATYGSLSLTGRPDIECYGPQLPGIIHVWPPTEPGDWKKAANQIERTIEAEGPDSVGAIFLEPVIHLLGMLVLPREYVARLRQVCDRHGILLVFDEIVTGFGRTGSHFAAQTFGVTPDILCAGKGISGGYAPLAAVLMHDRVAEVLRDENGLASLAPSHTYAANPVAAAAGCAAISHLEAGGYLSRVNELGDYLRRRLERIVGERGQVGGIGLLYGVKLNGNGRPFLGKRLEEKCLRERLLLRGADDWFVLAPAYTARNSDLDEICHRLERVLDKIFAEGEMNRHGP